MPEIFAPYIAQKTVQKSRLLQSAIVSADPTIDFSKGGKTVHIPFWKNLTGEDEILDDATAMSVNNIEAGEDIACVHLRGKSWGANDLVSLLAGSDAMEAIAEKSADYWAVQKQKVLCATLKGIFASTGMSSHVNNIASTTGDGGIISAEAMIDTEALLGDNYDSLGGIMCHSLVMNKLRKLDLIDTVPDSEGKRSLPYYMGMPVIIDDMLTEETSGSGDYPVYIFGAGAIAYNEGNGVEAVETDRDKLAGEDYLITRQQFTMHPRGIKWIGTPAGKTPSNTELETGTNWELVDDIKNIAIVKLVARVK